MNKPKNVRYEILASIKKNGPDVTALADEFQCTAANIWLHIRRLISEGLLEKPEPSMSSIRLTDAGREYKTPEPPKPVELQKCGHPIGRRLPNGKCHDCHDRKRKTYCTKNKKWLPMLRVQMRRNDYSR